MVADFDYSKTSLTVQGVAVELVAIYRAGEGDPIVFLHGFGSTKEDYADIARHPAFAGRPSLAYDAPGFGESRVVDPSKLSIPFLVATALLVLDHFGIVRFHLAGHSMGGLTSLMLAHAHPARVLSFTDIEGNIAPEDCFLSRQIHDYPAESDRQFFEDFIARCRLAPAWSSPLYASSLDHKVQVSSVRPVFASIVDLSDNGGLMGKFLNLPCPKMFMYGEQNNHLSYLAHIQANGVELAEIPECGHFPMYSNPTEMWRRIAAFIARAEGTK